MLQGVSRKLGAIRGVSREGNAHLICPRGKGKLSRDNFHKREPLTVTTSSPRPCEIHLRQVNEVPVLDVSGPLLLGESVELFQSQIQQLLAQGFRSIGVNLAEVNKMDSSGMGALVRAYTSVKKNGGNLHAFAPSTQVRQMLKMVRLDTVLSLFDDEAAALAQF